MGGTGAGTCCPVSYTHLDVYKRQTLDRDPHGNVQVSLIETEKLLSEMVATKSVSYTHLPADLRR